MKLQNVCISLFKPPYFLYKENKRLRTAFFLICLVQTFKIRYDVCADFLPSNAILSFCILYVMHPISAFLSQLHQLKL